MRCIENIDFCVIQGDSKSLYFNFTVKKVDPFDLTGYTLTFTLKKNKTDDDSKALIQKALTILDAEQGKALLELTPSETDKPLATYYYDIQLSKSPNFVRTFIRGKFKIDWQITEGA